MEKKFKNGFSSWQETHFMIVEAIVKSESNMGSIANERSETQGLGGLFELAEDLTNKFEQDLLLESINDGEWTERIEEFITKNL